jgi:hypothetical protein
LKDAEGGITKLILDVLKTVKYSDLLVEID